VRPAVARAHRRRAAAYEGVLLGQMRGTLETFSTLSAPVLLMGGGRGLPWLKPTMDALEKTLPHVRTVDAGLAAWIGRTGGPAGIFEVFDDPDGAA